MERRPNVEYNSVFSSGDYAEIKKDYYSHRISYATKKRRITRGPTDYIPSARYEDLKSVDQPWSRALIGKIFVPLTDRSSDEIRLTDNQISEKYISYLLSRSNKTYRVLYFLEGKLRSRLTQDTCKTQYSFCIDAKTNKILEILYG